MPTVLREGPYRCFFYSNERAEPPHIHVGSGDSVAKFWLDPVGFASNHGFAAHELTRVQSLVQKHRSELLSAWNDFFNSR